MGNDETGEWSEKLGGKAGECGFSLIEITFAIGLTAFCLLALLGLVPIGLTSTSQAIQQSVAVNLVSGVLADLRGVSMTPPFTSSRYQFVLPKGGETSIQSVFLRDDGRGGEINADATAEAQYRVSVWLAAPIDAEQREATVARVLISWPAIADRQSQQRAIHFAGSLEMVTALDCN